MDKEELQKKIAAYYSKLSPKAQEVFSKMEWLSVLSKITEKYGLNDNQKEFLASETTLLLLGLIHPIAFEEDLVKETGLTEDIADKILEELNKSIFGDIQQHIVEAFNANKKSETEGVVERQSNIVQDLDTRFDKLPGNIQEVVEKSNYQSLLYEISTAHKLSVTQMGTLDTITTDLIIGSIRPDEFKKAVIKKIGLPENEAITLVDEINEKVFKKIRGQLMALTDAGVRSQGPSTSNGTGIQTPKEDLNTLKSHGIEITDKQTTPQVEKLEIPAPKTEVHPLLAQKMSAPVQSTSVKTEYTATNSKPITTPTAQKPASYAPGTDPYRVIPE